MFVSEFNSTQRAIYDLSQKLVVIGVTGTKGKTTTAYLSAHLLNEAGIRAACTTTLDTRIPGEPIRPSCKTQGLMRDLLERAGELGIQHVVIETTSYSLKHGLADFCIYTGAVFTNLGHEHLNIHGSFENYLQAKRSLFTSLGFNRPHTGYGWAVLNADDPVTPEMLRNMSPFVPVLQFGLPRRPGRVPRSLHFYASRVRYHAIGTEFIVRSPERLAVPVQTRLLGEFNVYNALAATSAGYCLGLSPEQVQHGLATFTPPPGRFEVIGGGDGRPLVIVDYAHTPESLDQALRAARRLLRRGRLWTVFGCGGQTDLSKRPLMGQVAARQSDFVILTNDNPRRENPEAIAAQILAGCHNGKAQVQVQLDRREAIAMAIHGAQPGDIIVIAGKGHEAEQIFADRTIPFSDRAVALELLSQRV